MLRRIAISAWLMLIICMGCSESEKQLEVVRVRIFFVHWNLDTRIPLTCEDVIGRGDSVVIVDQSKVTDFVSLVGGMQPKVLPGYDHVSSRICVVFYDSNGVATKKISLSYQRSMEIDGKVFETDGRLFNLVVSYLPKDYLDS
jgi:hypothetical protein